MTVNYQTIGTTDQSIVYYDTVPRNGDLSTYSFQTKGDSHKINGLDIYTERTIHTVELTDLIPGQTYYFVAGDPEIGLSDEKKFRTIPENNGALRFVTGGDMSTSSKVPALLMHAAEQNPMFGLIGGDIAYANGRLEKWKKWDTWIENWETFMVTSDGYTIPLVMAIGNHEVNNEDDVDPSRMAPFYFGYFAQAETSYFTMRFGTNTVLFVLDSGHIVSHAGLQSEWLATEMAKFEAVPNKMAIYHVPMYPGHRDFDQSLSLAARTHWLPIFDKFALTVGFENHDHVMKRTKLLKANQPNDSGTLYIGDGCFGKGPRTLDQAGAYYLDRLEKKRHFWLVEIPDSTDHSASGMVFTAIDKEGLMFDTYELPKKLSVSIIEPINHADFNRGDNIDLRASAIFRGGNVARVEFFHAGAKIGEDITPPYEVTWFNLPLGELELRALATGVDGTSAWSDTVRISVHPRGYEKAIQTFTPTEDTYVRPKRKSRNYGERTYLRLHGSPDFYNAYLKFHVANVSGNILSAKLRLHSLDNNVTGGSIYSISNEFINSNEPWGEAGLIAANAPLIAGSPLDSHGPVIKNQWIEYEVTDAITGNDTLSLALQIDHGELEYSSKEGSHSPQLVVEFVRPLPIISSFTPTYGTPSSIVTITGANFDSTKVIAFNNTSANHFEITSDTSIQVMVPLQAITGKIAITNNEGT
ncbi:DNRLRE domain-containing protein, partial [bacterium]|nr:DNRLRE domain-containing protein [bacterium]